MVVIAPIHWGVVAIAEIDPNNSMSYLIRGLAKKGIKQIDAGCLDFCKALELGDEKILLKLLKNSVRN